EGGDRPAERRAGGRALPAQPAQADEQPDARQKQADQAVHGGKAAAGQVRLPLGAQVPPSHRLGGEVVAAVATLGRGRADETALRALLDHSHFSRRQPAGSPAASGSASCWPGVTWSHSVRQVSQLSSGLNGPGGHPCLTKIGPPGGGCTGGYGARMRRGRLLVPIPLAVGCPSPDVVDPPPPLQTADQREADYKRNLRADRTWAEQ